MDPREALALFFVLALISFGLVLTMNPLTIGLSFVGLLLAVSYPFMKRFISNPQLVLGMAFSWSIPMAYAAQADALPLVAWLLFSGQSALDRGLRYPVRHGGSGR